MERINLRDKKWGLCVNIFADKDNLRQVLTIGAILLCFAIIWQLSLIQATADYKQAMLEHDYALAGKLSQFL